MEIKLTGDIRKAVQRGIERGLEDHGIRVHAEAVDRAPLRHGHLRSSGSVKLEGGGLAPGRDSSGRFLSRVGATVRIEFDERYAAAQEQGYAEVPTHTRGPFERRNRSGVGTHRVRAHQVRAHRNPTTGEWSHRIGQSHFLESSVKHHAVMLPVDIGNAVERELRRLEASR